MGFPEITNKVQGSGGEPIKFGQGMSINYKGFVVAALPSVSAMELEF